MLTFLVLLAGFNPYYAGDCLATVPYRYSVLQVGRYGVLARRLSADNGQVYFTLRELKYVDRADCFEKLP